MPSCLLVSPNPSMSCTFPVCPWDHLVKDLSMEPLESEPGMWEAPRRSLRINPLFLLMRKLRLKRKYGFYKVPQPLRAVPVLGPGHIPPSVFLWHSTVPTTQAWASPGDREGLEVCWLWQFFNWCSDRTRHL